MAKHWLLVLFAFAFVGAKADDLADFSNNLFTDLGPLLALFGDSMTKQYLSESTSSLDYVIFAMAPVGIMTAIISVIRVCGHSALRAFIGRSQEGDGIVEAELCTSTSRDVCELFNRGGITRVLGRPSILELIHVPRQEGLQTPASESKNDKAGLYLSRDYFSHHYENSESPDWTEVKRRQTDSANRFSPNPNLSLNIGIVKRPPWVFVAIAVTGIILQVGVLVLAGVGVWVLDWTPDEQQDASPGNSAVIMFIAGTCFMCLGMGFCAALIGQTTHERLLKRTSLTKSSRSRILWLQPGPQVIGDQSFDPFAHLENSEKGPLQVWMSSRKIFKEKFETYTYVAVFFVLAGYIVQFIGLRGLSAWISLAQVGITIFMSILRGCLRMQRLDRNGNEFAKMPDLVAGHELDWLAFEIAGSWSRCHVTGQDGRADNDETAGRTSSSSRSARTLTETNSSLTIGAGNTSQHTFEDLLRIRVRLAHLTGHFTLTNINDTESQLWKDEFVKVRVKATQLSAALCQAVAGLFPRRQQDIVLRIRATTKEQDSPAPEHQVSVTLGAPIESSQASWRVDSARIEAILGLWMWTLVSDERLRPTDDHSAHTVSPAEKVLRSRIVSAGFADDPKWNDKAGNTQGEMDLWLGTNAVQFSKATLTVDKQHLNGLGTLWQPMDGEKQHWEIASTEKNMMNSTSQRFCGWNLVYRTANGSSSNATSIRVQLAPVLPKTSLLDLCAQELFTALLVSLAGFLSSDTIGKTTIIGKADTLQLQNTTISIIEEAFVENNLGSPSDLRLSIIPPLKEQLRSPSSEEILSVLTQATRYYRQESKWGRAEILLRWCCASFGSSSEDPGQLSIDALRELGELYRYALNQKSNDTTRKMGNDGIEWMTRTYDSMGKTNPEVKEILDSYREIAQRISLRSRTIESNSDDPKSVPQQLVKAISDRDRTETLYHLCFMTSDLLNSPDSQQAFPLAVRNDWSEVVAELSEMNANLDSLDDVGRSAVSHCAELGYESRMKSLIDQGAALDLVEMDQMTPLSWASRNGHDRIVKLLLESKQVHADRPGKSNQRPLWWAVKGAHTSVAKVLIDSGVDTEPVVNGQTPLTAAIRAGHDAIFHHLLEARANIQSYPSGVRTPLATAAELGRTDLVGLLLEKGAGTEPVDNNGNTPLVLAAEGGHTATVRMLVERGAAIDGQGPNMPTPLLMAAKGGYEHIVRLLLKKNADTECRDKDGFTPLLLAAKGGHDTVVQLLLNNNADMECCDPDGSTPLMLANDGGHERVARLLLDNGADFERERQYRPTPLISAVEDGDVDTARLLLEKREASPGRTDKHGRTPLIFAVGRGHEELTELLLKYDKMVDHKDTYGNTALTVAARCGHVNIVRCLIEKGADVELKAQKGASPLIFAARRPDKTHFGVVRLLVERGANIKSKDDQGRTPLSVAKHYKHRRIAEYLEEKEKEKEKEDERSRH